MIALCTKQTDRLRPDQRRAHPCYIDAEARNEIAGMQLERQLQEEGKSARLDAHISGPQLAASGGFVSGGCGGVIDELVEGKAGRRSAGND